jgi:hypothetical protein
MNARACLNSILPDLKKRTDAESPIANGHYDVICFTHECVRQSRNFTNKERGKQDHARPVQIGTI